MIFNRWYIARSCIFCYMRRAFWLYADCVPLCRARAYPCVYLTRRQSGRNREGLNPIEFIFNIRSKA